MKSDCFISAIVPIIENHPELETKLSELHHYLRTNYNFFEIIVVDGISDNLFFKSVSEFIKDKESIRVLQLSRSMGFEVSSFAGLDSCSGDVVIIMDILTDPVSVLQKGISLCQQNNGIVFGVSEGYRGSPVYRFLSHLFHRLLEKQFRVDLQRNSTQLRFLSRHVVNAMTQMKDRVRNVRFLTSHSGFPNAALHYIPSSSIKSMTVSEGFVYAFEVLQSFSSSPLRWLSKLSLGIAFLNVLYSMYIFLIYLFKSDVTQGWTTLSAQLSVMFFFIFIVLAAISEYVGRILIESFDRPLYYVVNEKNGVSQNPEDILNITSSV